MLSKICSTEKLGLVFADFRWPSSTPAFKAVNLIYGWNGCGKTTLTRLFDEHVDARQDINFELEWADGRKSRPEDSFPAPVRVFNQDYVQRNVRVLESKANTISVVLGEENKELEREIAALESELNGVPGDAAKRGKLQEFEGYSQKKARKERDNESALSGVARTIGAAISGSAVASRTYRAPNARDDLAALSEKAVLTDDELDRQQHVLREEVLPELPRLEVPSLQTEGGVRDVLEVALTILADAERLCASTVESQLIPRLAQDPAIAAWVEQGIKLHRHEDWTDCEYCGNRISLERMAQLARHFSDADRQLKTDLDDAMLRLDHVSAAVSRLTAHDPVRLYREFRNPYSERVERVESAKVALSTELAALQNQLTTKKARTTERVAVTTSIVVGPLQEAIEAANSIVIAHNERSTRFQEVQRGAVQNIKTHYLSTVQDEVAKRNVEIAELAADLEFRASEIEDIRRQIEVARAKISSAHHACEILTNALSAFLGRQELRFEPETRVSETGETLVIGYRIMRGSQAAIHLSEGEKTALAFVYFVAHLNDGQFAKARGLVIVDDPISSLDSNSLYQAFSFLKNAVKDCAQVFILTHNFEFLKLLLNWRGGARMGKTGYYMIQNYMDGDARRASIVPMDRELKDYESEYHYLFRRLKDMRAAQDGTIARAYDVPNIARKVWDTFLMYRVPSGGRPYQKMERLKQEGFDPQKLDAIYKFTNDQSHMTGGGFNPALVPEAKNVLGSMFDMMQLIAPEHFAVLDQATGS